MAIKYKIGSTIISSPKKLYIQNGIYGHKKGDFFEPCSPSLLFKIEMAKLDYLSTKNNTKQK